MRSVLGICVLAALISACAARDTGKPPLEVISDFDVQRYMGTWYEIGRYPNRFQEGCVGTTATYSFDLTGSITVENSCYEDHLGGRLKTITGKAWVVDKREPAKLHVRFFWPFKGDYWVIQLDPDYQWAVVGHPDRTYLWILARTPRLDRQTLQGIFDRLVQQGYEIARLQKTVQPAD